MSSRVFSKPKASDGGEMTTKAEDVPSDTLNVIVTLDFKPSESVATKEMVSTISFPSSIQGAV